MANRSDPATSAAAITPHDTNELTIPTRGLYVGGAGNIVVTMSGSNVTFSSVPAGTMLPFVVTKVLNTGTTATNIVAVW